MCLNTYLRRQKMIQKIKSSIQQPLIVIQGESAIVHLNESHFPEVEETEEVKGSSEYWEYDGVIIANALNYAEDCLEILAKKEMAIQFLNETDFKFLNAYKAKENEDLASIELKRDEYRMFLRENK